MFLYNVTLTWLHQDGEFSPIFLNVRRLVTTLGKVETTQCF